LVKIKKHRRNKSCFCGSNKKYKKCHGSLKNKTSLDPHIQDEINKKLKELEAIQRQREQQQGLGKPIISTLFKGYRIVAVGSRIYWSQNWKTFHDFLGDYLKFVFGSDWGNDEIKKPFEDRHPIMQWYDIICKYQRKHTEQKGRIYSAPMIGAADAYYNLSYNLYLLAHNVKIQTRLVERLKDKHDFNGAFYETYVAAAFIKAGFDLDFENEKDISTSHCEFTATCKKTKNKYSVEAKSRRPGKDSAIVSNQLYNALKKKANYTRIVFIDVNVPDKADDSQSVSWLKEALNSLRVKEDSMTINGAPAPPAYIFLTNQPFIYNIETANFRRAVLSEGYKIPDFKMGAQFASIRDVLRVREKHADMEQLMTSIRTHYVIPVTFDGEIPEFAFGESVPRLKIGHKYLVQTSDGREVIGELTAATVVENEKLVYCAHKLVDGRSIIGTYPLTDDELSAYKKHPDTFFGVYQPIGKEIKDPMELFDFFYTSYRKTPKERLLEFMKDHPDIDNLRQESQEELVITYCERLVYSVMNSNKSLQGNKSPA
jgi:hypothetical protein